MRRLALACLILACSIDAVSSHDFYAWECCSDQDCQPLPEGAVEERSDGYHIAPFRGLRTETVIGFRDPRIKQSPDGRFHGCEYPINHVACLYVPPRSF